MKPTYLRLFYSSLIPAAVSCVLSSEVLLASKEAISSSPDTDICDLIPVKRVPPEYPRTTRLEEGWVIVEFDVRADGSVANIRVVESSVKDGFFDRTTVYAVSQWRFAPHDPGLPTDSCQAPQSKQRITIEYLLEDADPQTNETDET